MISRAAERALAAVDEAARAVVSARPSIVESGQVLSVGDGIIRIAGLAGVRLGEVVRLPGKARGMVLDLTPDEVGVITLDETPGLESGSRVLRSGEVARVPVGEALLGRVIDPLGRPRDGKGAVATEHFYPLERPPTPIADRAPVERPLQTGIKSIDALVPIGRGQRQLILGDRQTGKTSIALDTILNQRTEDVLCVYLAVGQRNAATARAIRALQDHGAMAYTVVMLANASDPAGLQFLAPYAATSVGEYFMEHGRDVLVVYDDLTKHANTYRELSLLLRRPPGREAYPGDVFYVHSRLLERGTRLKPELGGGSLTALPIVETQAQDISAYIATNIISITDGQIYLDPNLYQQGVLPAVDVGMSVSRVGGKAQLPAYHAVSGRLRLAYSQFRELEMFARISTRLDPTSQQAIERGRRLREILKQDLNAPVPVADQLAILLAFNEGVFDAVPVDRVRRAENAVREQMAAASSDLSSALAVRRPLEQRVRAELLELTRAAVKPMEE